MEWTEHHRIPVIWQQGPPPFTAALVLRVGVQDETFRTFGATHAMEHLAMAAQPRSALDCNAAVGPGLTVFHATGAPATVALFLNGVARALTHLPLEDLPRERGVLEAEGITGLASALGHAAIVRYGSVGPGLVSGIGIPPSALREQDVAEHTRRHVVRANAALVMTGPPPAELDVQLPDGPQPDRVPVVALPWPYPQYRREAAPVAVISYTQPRRAASVAFDTVLAEHLTADLRGRRGIAYSVDHESLDADRSVTLSAMSVQTREEHASTVALAMWDAIREIARTPTPQGELDHAVATMQARLEDPRGVMDVLVETARHHLEGSPPWSAQEEIAAARRVTPDDIRHAAAAAAESAFLLIPSTTGKDPEGMVDFHALPPPRGPYATGTSFHRRTWSLAPNDLRLTVSDEGIVQRARGYTHGAFWRDVVGVAAAPDHRSIVTRGSDGFDVIHRHVRHADRLFALIDAYAGDRLFEDDPLPS